MLCVIFCCNLSSPPGPPFIPEPQAWLDNSKVRNLPKLKKLPTVVWEEGPPRPGCILTLDSRYNPEGVLAVEAAVARLLRDLGVEGEVVGGGGIGGERIGGEGIRGEGVGGEGILGKEGVREGVGNGEQDGGKGKVGGWDEREVEEGKLGKRERHGEGRWYGGQRRRRLKGGEGAGDGEGEGEGKREGKEEGERKGEGKGEGEGRGKVKGEEGGEGEKVAEEGAGRGVQEMPERWRRFYDGLPKMMDGDGKEYVGKMPIWVALAVNMLRLYVRRHGYQLVVENESQLGQRKSMLRLYVRRHGYQLVVENESQLGQRKST
ncbi:unnamed protein product [Closterium sp. Naga37s-1]|nr:unnamed protein product [Closterium sp. Naga37s-1]